MRRAAPFSFALPTIAMPADPPAPTVVLLGASGLVGGHALHAFAADPRWGRVVTLDRRPLPPAGPTHEPHVVDMGRLADHAALLACDTLVCALGTTMKQAGSREAFRSVDVELPFQAAQLAHGGGATQVLLVSATGADEGSAFFYNRAKGEAERRVGEVGFETVQILRPSLLTGERDEVRVGERIGEAVLGALAPVLIGPLRALRPTPAAAVGRALAVLAARRPVGTHVYDAPAIRAWASGGLAR